MVHSILVPLDGSPFAEHALPVACQIARRSGATIRLAHVHVPILNVALGPWQMGGVPILDEQIDAQIRDYEQQYLATLCQRYAADGIDITCELLHGPIVAVLEEHAAEIDADLVIMTTHGHGSFSRVWLGSVADAFIRHSTTPTLLLRPDEEQPIDQTWTIERMLIPLDGSALSERILAPACRLGDLLGVAYRLLMVITPLATEVERATPENSPLEDPATRSKHDMAQTYLDQIAADLRAQGRTVDTQVVVGSHPAQAILDVAQREAIDLLALATHGRGGLSRLLIGSVADKVVRGAKTPVLLVHPRETHGSADAGVNHDATILSR